MLSEHGVIISEGMTIVLADTAARPAGNLWNIHKSIHGRTHRASKLRWNT